jgi:hypothetical protein
VAGDLGQHIEQWFRSSLQRTVAEDRVLSQAAQENSDSLAEVPGEDPEGDPTYLRFLLQRHSVRDAATMALAIRFREDRGALERKVDTFLSQRAPAGEISHYGVGVAAAGSGRVATVILVRRRVDILAVRAIPGQPLELCGRLRSGRRPQVLLVSPEGALLETSPKVRQGYFCANLEPAQRGRYQVEIMVDGVFGPEVASLFELHVAVDPPRMPTRKLYPPEGLQRDSVEALVLTLLNRSRRESGLGPLPSLPALARTARRHSEEMMALGFFGHRSPERGDLARRLGLEGVDYVQASENLALSTSPRRAHDALLQSPSHRRNVLDPRVTHAGVGVAVDPVQGLIYVTECFARLAPVIHPDGRLRQ